MARTVTLEPIVSVEWLHNHLDNNNLLVFDASMPKVTSNSSASVVFQIPSAQFFDIKQVFSDVSAPFPNTVPSEEQFTKEVQNLGVNSNSMIVVYDDKGIYSSARVWYLFKAFGFNNVAVLDGGLPQWKTANYPLEAKQINARPKGNFIAKYNPKAFKFFNDIKASSSNAEHLIIDARSANRFKGISPEPRKGLRSGNIPNSVNIPYSELLVNGHCFKSKKAIEKEFNAINAKEQHLVFSCGSGITACILALGAELINKTDYSVYDGSWTEYGSLTTE
ncbi:sulfurtransferase [Pontimicrobium aquaticum]|uniref:Sulfurtransferase n=1 Tax=Pontimicrobium aquaticum TaxID=2565367 RepID=A0A4U0ENY6_9FLAO|nr:sulfurtransferase [Pontimicrobium aquaticum]TJY33333.1 sulfurtransferase [Pontimicrobium aquaticum]